MVKRRESARDTWTCDGKTSAEVREKLKRDLESLWARGSQSCDPSGCKRIVFDEDQLHEQTGNLIEMRKHELSFQRNINFPNGINRGQMASAHVQ